MNGLELLSDWICLDVEDETKKFGNATQLRKIRIRLYQLAYDLALNDDSIFDDGFFVRDNLGTNTKLITRLLSIIEGADFSKPPEYQMRAYILQLLFRIYQRKPEIKF